MEADYERFLKYSSSSNEITLHYELNKDIPDAWRFIPINLEKYESEFSSNVNKNKFFGYITINKNATFGYFKNILNKITGFPVNVMTKFGYWGGTEADENGKIWTIVSNNYNINDNTLIRNSSYNDQIYIADISIFI